MSKVIRHEACPKCRARGQDSRGDNLGVYEDDGAHCFSCGYHRNGKFQMTFLPKETINDIEKAVLPRDFTREIPAEGWKWLLSFGLPYSYWKPYCGYSPKENRLIITYGEPVKFSQGRALTVGDAKWKSYGYGHNHVQVLGGQVSKEVVLTEDIISAHKVGQVCDSIPLFGTHIHDVVIKALQALNRPVVLWLDADQYQLLPKKVHRLQSLLRHPVRYVSTELDPKSQTLTDIKELLK